MKFFLTKKVFLDMGELGRGHFLIIHSNLPKIPLFHF